MLQALVRAREEVTVALDTDLFLGVDVGGTKILAGLVTSTGQVLARCKSATPRKGGARAVVAAIGEAMDCTLTEGRADRERLRAVGVAAPGVVNPETGRIVFAPNTSLVNLDLVPLLEKRYRVPAAVGNDVNLGTLGECWLGAGRGARNVVGLFPGTGIGGGLVLDGRLYSGAREVAGEIGHMIIQIGGPRCGCGMRGCLEAIASRTAIERDIRQAVKAGQATALTAWLKGDLSVIKSSLLRQALEAKDALVTEVITRASEAIGLACINIRHLLDPERIVLGGGMIEACAPFMLPTIEKTAATDTIAGVRPGGRIVLSTLGDDAVLLGAVACARMKIGLALEGNGERAPADYPTIDSLAYGRVTIGGTTYTTDIQVRGNGKVKKRNKKKAKELAGDAHRVGVEELEKLCKGDPETLIVGAGQEGHLKLAAEARAFLKARKIAVRVLRSPEAVKAYNALTGKKALLLHVTC